MAKFSKYALKLALIMLVAVTIAYVLLWYFVFPADLRTGAVEHIFDTGLGSVPRMIFTPDIPNMRDVGGWKTCDGRRVRQGILFRSACFNQGYEWYCSGTRTHQILDETKNFIREELGIKTDIDLRTKEALRGMAHSPLGDDVRLVNIPARDYGAIDTEEGAAAIVAILRELVKEDTLPAVVHCKLGMDRGGSFVFVLNALLGVGEDDLRRDWLLSSHWHISQLGRQEDFNELLSVARKYPGETLQEQIEAYLTAHGLEESVISRIREIFLED